MVLLKQVKEISFIKIKKFLKPLADNGKKDQLRFSRATGLCFLLRTKG
jgi:hypothetical protein